MFPKSFSQINLAQHGYFSLVSTRGLCRYRFALFHLSFDKFLQRVQLIFYTRR